MYSFGYRYGESSGGITYDPDALAYIAAWETNTSVSMQSSKKDVINTFVKMLKGTGTTNGSDLWTRMSLDNGRIYPMTPISDASANALAYEVELLTASVQGSFVNFVPGDFTPQGVCPNISSIKYFDTGLTPADLNRYSVNVGYYVSVGVGVSSEYDFGAVFSASSRFLGRVLASANGTVAALNSGSTTGTNDLATDAGWVQFQRIPSDNFVRLYIDNTLAEGFTGAATTTPSSVNIRFHRVNGLATANNTRTLATYTLSRHLEPNFMVDMNEAIQYLNANIISGGR